MCLFLIVFACIQVLQQVQFYEHITYIELYLHFENKQPIYMKVVKGIQYHDLISQQVVEPTYNMDVYIPEYTFHHSDSLFFYYKREPMISLSMSSVEELTLLKGIGIKTAIKIAEFSQLFGFHTITDLLFIKGIGTIKYEAIKLHLSL